MSRICKKKWLPFYKKEARKCETDKIFVKEIEKLDTTLDNFFELRLLITHYSVILKGDPTGVISTLDVKDDPNLKVLSWIVDRALHVISFCQAQGHHSTPVNFCEVYNHQRGL